MISVYSLTFVFPPPFVFLSEGVHMEGHQEQEACVLAGKGV